MTVNAENIDSGNEVSWFLCSEVTGEDVGTGDAVEETFDLNNYAAEYTETVYLDGVAQERGTDYTITYRPSTKTVTEIVFSTPPGSGVAITADYASCPDSEDDALLSQDVSVSPTTTTIEADIHGRDAKLKKVVGHDLTLTLNHLYVDCERIAMFCGDVEDNTPATGKRKWTFGTANKVYLLFGRLTRKGTLKKLYYLWGVSGLPSITMPAKDFVHTDSGDLAVDLYEIVEDMPS